jgi:ATP-dependent Lon protease
VEKSITKSRTRKSSFLLTSGVWGVGELFYIPPDTEKGKGQVWMRDFKPFQIARIDLDYFIECRQYFSIEEWILSKNASSNQNVTTG